MVEEAQRLEAAGASLLNFTNSGPVVGAAVAEAVSIPVVGGFGGGPWLDGRMRMAHAAIGYAASALDNPPDTYANVARIAHDAIAAYAADVRGRGRSPAACRCRRPPEPTVDRAPDDRPTAAPRPSTVRPVPTEAHPMPTAVVDGITTRSRRRLRPALLMFSPGGFDSTLDSWRTVGHLPPAAACWSG